MINNSEFADRLKIIMDYYQLSASGFADRIQVQRSSISHLLSGRNRPSLDFVLKVIKEFKEVELYWLLNGKGSFPSGSASAPIEPTPYDVTSEVGDSPITDITKTKEASGETKKIERIVIFYDDGTFKEYIK